MKDRALYFKPSVTMLRILLTYTGEIHVPIDFYCISRTDKVYSNSMQICISFRGLLVTLLPSEGNISYGCHRTLLDVFFCSREKGSLIYRLTVQNQNIFMLLYSPEL